MIERVIEMVVGRLVTDEAFGEAFARLFHRAALRVTALDRNRSGGRPATTSRWERTVIEQALQAARFNKSKAKALGLTRHQLYIRVQRYGFG